jgi:2-alkyl-3-oxoalkanoate reductase
MRLAVTGASGFIGGAVCRAATDAGHQVHAYGRRAHTDPAHIGGAPYRSWDITAGLLDTPPDVDAVIHCAGSVTDWGPKTVLRKVNVTGTTNVLESFPEPVRFVHVSTASVYNPRVPTVSAHEDTARIAPFFRGLDAYGSSKADAEIQVALLRLNSVVLRPHAVYGPGDTTLLPRLLDAVRKTPAGLRLLAVGDGRQRFSLTSIGNLTQACLLAATADDVSGVFNITDAEPTVLDDALRTILAARAIAATPYYLPYRIAYPVAAVVETAARLAVRAGRPNTRPPRLTRYAVRHLALERTLDISAARAELGYVPAPTSFEGADRW